MSNTWVIYRKDNGEITPRSYAGTNVAAQLREGEGAISGVATWRTHRVEAGRLVALIEPRIAPSIFAKWNPESAAWVDSRDQQRKAADQWAIVRAERDKLLADTDWVAIKQAEQGGPIAAEWRTYRQALRDITLQADPFSVAWPTRP